MNENHYEQIKVDLASAKTELAANTLLTKEMHEALLGKLDGKKGLMVRVGKLEDTVDGPDGEPQLGLKAKVRDFDNTRTKIIGYVGGIIAISTAVWFLYDKVFQRKVPMF